jgi:hypothetical protein
MQPKDGSAADSGQGVARAVVCQPWTLKLTRPSQKPIPRMWTQRPTIIGGRSDPGDREGLRSGVPVGRVFQARNMQGPRNWVCDAWNDRGSASSMAEALAPVRGSAL